jgi:hypothetical protein
MPAIKEESRMINFALLIIVLSSNASKVMKIDIVKPILLKPDTNNCFPIHIRRGAYKFLRIRPKD